MLAMAAVVLDPGLAARNDVLSTDEANRAAVGARGPIGHPIAILSSFQRFAETVLRLRFYGRAERYFLEWALM